ncbi:MAG: hypothetical protein M3282_13420 [Gemmatimonadota bacterium]|nr:hypothetical protein [Gemmatimonadota bacterium]
MLFQLSAPTRSGTRAIRLLARRGTLLAGLVAPLACATLGTQAPAETSPTDTQPAGPPATAGWAIRTRQHVDLWLHGYALLQRDTARVPFFRRGYRDRMLAERRQLGVTTALDLNADRLTARLAANPALVNGQFVPLYFGSFDELRRAVDLFVRVEGEPRAAGSQEGAFYVALLAASFSTAADREWLRVFTQSLTEENDRFYRQHWTAAQRTQAPARAAVEGLWRDTYGRRFERFLTNTQQSRGEILLSLPLDGEGRTVAATGGRSGLIAVQFPEDASAAVEALYVFAHEVVIPVVNTAIADNVTPAEQRSGAADRYAAHAAVRGGALLLERVAPDLAQGYMRYYLRAAGAQVGATADPRTAFVAAFPLPELIISAATRQLEVVLGGI